MDAKNLLVIAGVGAGAWWFFNRQKAAAVTPATPGGTGAVDTCMKYRPNWNRTQCETRLRDIENAHALVKAKVQSYMLTRDAFIKTGNMKDLAAIDAEIVPWQRQKADLESDYFKLTGLTLG